LLGVSVYLGNQGETEQDHYLKRMSEAGFKSIFTSLLIPEDDASQYKQLLKTLGKQALQYNMELMPDISPVTLSNLGYNYENLPEIQSWGITGLRIDYGLDAKLIASLSQKIKISLNASTLDPTFLAELTSNGLRIKNVEVWHNFYPRPETGLSRGYFIKQNLWLRKQGFSVMAFVPGDEKLRGPLEQGLPTLEEHRFLPPFEGCLDLMKNCYVDKVLVGDRTIKEETFNQFKIYHDGIIPLRYKPRQIDQVSKNLLGLTHRNRLDPARDVIRSEPARILANKNGYCIKPHNTVERVKGSITIDNLHYKRYQGELQITLTDLPGDDKVNVLGKVIESDLPLLTHIDAGQKFKLIEV
jgi:uncharacterized protein